MTSNVSSGFATHDTYKYIVDWALQHKGNTPSHRQIAAGCGFSHATAHYHIQQLIDKGLLERLDGALCISHAEISVPYTAFNALRERAYPDVTTMRFIPKEVRFAKERSTLAKLGIESGDSLDEEFRQATYPEGWHYVPLDDKRVEKSGSKVWLLRDGEGTDRGVLSFDPNEYKAKLLIME